MKPNLQEGRVRLSFYSTWFYKFLIVSIVFNSCEKSDPIPVSSTTIRIVSLEISPDKTTFLANNQDLVNFVATAKGLNNQVISTLGIEYYINDVKTGGAQFSTANPGKYTVYAKLNNILSNMVELTAIDPVEMAKVSLVTTTRSIIADGNSAATFTPSYIDESGKNHPINSSDWTLYVDGEVISGNVFSTVTAGNYSLVAKSSGFTSDTVKLVAREAKIYPLVTIPVIFHIAHYGDAVNEGLNLNASRVKMVLDHINKAFSNEDGSKNPNAVNMHLQFRLATKGENGALLAEPGITRYDITNFDDGYSDAVSDKAHDKAMGSNERARLSLQTSWDPTQYLNVWVTPTENGGSWARLPLVYAENPLLGLTTVVDGCNDCIQNWLPYMFIHTSSFTEVSSTPIHEFGHSFGLLHVFSNNNCQTSDYCLDTYSYAITTNEPCADNQGLLERDNFMDYQSTGIVRNTFTYDQRERVRHVLNYGYWVSKLPFSEK